MRPPLPRVSDPQQACAIVTALCPTGLQHAIPRPATLDRTLHPPKHPDPECRGYAAAGVLMRAVPGRPTAKNISLNASTTSTLSIGGPWSNISIAPSKSAPRPPDLSPPSSIARLHRACVFCRAYRLRYSIRSTDRPSAMSSPAHAKVTIPLPPALWGPNARDAHTHPVGSGAMALNWMPLTT